MSMTISSVRSLRSSCTASYQNSSPRLPSPLDPSTSSFSHPLPGGRASCDSPSTETSDTLSPLRERLDSGFIMSPRPRTSSLSRPPRSRATSPERSPIMGSIPFQPHRAHSRLSSPTGSPFGTPLPGSSPLHSSPLAGPPQSPVPHSRPSLSPPHSPIPCSPASIHGSLSQFQSNTIYSPSHPTKSQFHFPQSSPVTIPSSSRFARAQSFTQQPCANPYAASLPTESRLFTRESPVTGGHSLVQEKSTPIKGDSTPLNEAPTRWWGGRRGWVDDWDNVVQQSQGMYEPHSPIHGESDGAVGIDFVQPGHENSLAFRGPFGRCGSGSGAFLNEELRASFDGVGGVGARFVDPSSDRPTHAQTGVNAVLEMEGIPVSQPVPLPVPSVMGLTAQNGNPVYGELEVGAPLVEGLLGMQKARDHLQRRGSSHVHGNASGFVTDAMTMMHGQGDEHVGGRSRRFSNASTRSSASYVSCMSGPSQSRSQSLLMSSSHSHTSTCPSLYSLGVGIEEAEREERRSRTFWARRNSGTTLRRQSRDVDCSADDFSVAQEYCSHLVHHGVNSGLGSHEVVEECLAEEDVPRNSKNSLAQAHEKEIVKHRSFFTRVGSRHGDVPDAQVQQIGYRRAEKCVSLAITSILPAATITVLSPVGEALLKARDSAIFVGRELAPVVRDTLSVSAHVLSLAPLPGLEEAAKALLSVWSACLKMDTNRLSCLRLAERCATLLYSVHCDIAETGDQATLAEPVERLCGALVQIQTFLDTQLHRPFLKRYARREEIARELQACNDAITDAASRFGLSVQIRTYHEVWSAAVESRRFTHEAQAILSLDHQLIQQQFAMMSAQQAQMRREVVVTQVTDDTATVEANECDGCGHLEPPPAYGQPVQLSTIASATIERNQTEFGSSFSPRASTSSTLSSGNWSDASDSVPTPTNATFTIQKTETRTTTQASATALGPAVPVLQALREVHLVQDSVDAAADEADLRGTLEGALDVHNDVEMVRRLQVAREEIPEAAETLRRMLGRVDGMERVVPPGEERDPDTGNTELDRKFLQSGFEAMTRLMSGRPRGEGQKGELGSLTGSVGASELPSWTITRYEVIRTRKIGAGFVSDVYLGHWRKLTVVVKVLTHSVSRDAFVRYIEEWNALDHPNVLPLYGASSAVGEKPWFLVSKFCGGDNLVASLKRAKEVGAVVVGDETTVRVDLLRFMQEIAQGMTYLHGRGVLHGALMATNVLLDESGRCVLSDFGQHEIKLEAHRSSGRLMPTHIRWKAPEVLTSKDINDRLTNAADVYAFATCCVEILGMGDLPWATLNDEAIRELVLDKDERPPIPTLDGNADVADAIADLLKSSWVRQPDSRPSFASIVASLDALSVLHDRSSPQLNRSLSPLNDIELAPIKSTESSPADEQYETASESMRTEVNVDTTDSMMNVSLTSPRPILSNSYSVFHVSASHDAEATSIVEQRDNDTPTSSPENALYVNSRAEETYRLIAGTNHTFHNSLTHALWSPAPVELGAVGYISKPQGNFITLFNALDPLQSYDERLRRLPSMHGYGKFEIQRREEGKRSVAQRGLDAISGFLTFRARSDRSHPERIARQYTFPLVQGKPSAHLCVEKTLYRYMDHLEAPMMWFKQHVDLILEVCTPRHAIRGEELIIVVGTLDAPDWALFVSDAHLDGRAHFHVFSSREKGEPWGMYTVEPSVKNGTAGQGSRSSDAAQVTFASKVSCVSADVAADTVMVAGLEFGKGIQAPTVM